MSSKQTMSAKPASSKKSTTAAVAAAAVAPVAKPAKAAKAVKLAAAPAEAAVVVAPAKKAAARKPEAEAAVLAAAPEVAAAVTAPAPAAALSIKELSKTDENMNAILEQLSALLETTRKLQSSAKAAKVVASKELKEAKKSKGKVRDLNRKKRTPTGFAVPTQLSDDLCAFLGLAKKTVMSRTDVTKSITAYVKGHSLTVGRKINADAPLRKLLGLATDAELTYFNLQSFLKHHYTKPAGAAAGAVGAAAKSS
jgi:uncharacterized protein YfiM (DUF2279 family)